ncbi:MAG: hypothetical protein R3297_08595, partial [Desulfobulbales bacterium]|nr:hypothetical protein [Desulfobulbales bacterium]
MLKKIGRISIFFLLILFPRYSQGAIPDNIVCNECHTMHNSQGGTSMAAGGNLEALLVNSCAGCHSGLNGTSAINNSSKAPLVMHTGSAPGNTSGADNMLAGGSFYWVTIDDRKGHNVNAFGIGPDSTYADPPLGGVQLNCAGQFGCHGYSSIAGELKSLMPAHHIADSVPLTGASIAESYRFLSGIIGTEDSDWEYTVAPDDHNQYKASSTWDSTAVDTITYICARCHGNFHGNPGVGGSGSSPWVRHPTDIDSGAAAYNGTEFDNYT